MSLQLSTAPSLEPVKLEEAKEYLRVEHSADDAEITRLIKAARQYVERVTWRALISQTWKLRLNCFPCGPIYLPKPPLSSVSSVSYVDADGNSQTWSSSLWTSDIYSEPGVLEPAYGEAYPTTRAIRQAITITFVAGYGTATTDVPEEIRRALMEHVGKAYEHRGVLTPEMLESIDAALQPFKFSDDRVLSFT